MLDFMVMEAVALKVQYEDSEADRKAAEKQKIQEKVQAAHNKLRNFT